MAIEREHIESACGNNYRDMNGLNRNHAKEIYNFGYSWVHVMT